MRPGFNNKLCAAFEYYYDIDKVFPPEKNNDWIIRTGKALSEVTYLLVWPFCYLAS